MIILPSSSTCSLFPSSRGRRACRRRQSGPHDARGVVWQQRFESRSLLCLSYPLPSLLHSLTPPSLLIFRQWRGWARRGGGQCGDVGGASGSRQGRRRARAHRGRGHGGSGRSRQGRGRRHVRVGAGAMAGHDNGAGQAGRGGAPLRAHGSEKGAVRVRRRRRSTWPARSRGMSDHDGGCPARCVASAIHANLANRSERTPEQHAPDAVHLWFCRNIGLCSWEFLPKPATNVVGGLCSREERGDGGAELRAGELGAAARPVALSLTSPASVGGPWFMAIGVVG
uniref:Uncharacterized protein n=1 Tax=Setaria viridis TaxID=4556 RepID=A0A4U6UAY8_SETVI|nr:hypothetical protein SEVIR_5G065901v2 [Setaria viridis]